MALRKVVILLALCMLINHGRCQTTEQQIINNLSSLRTLLNNCEGQLMCNITVLSTSSFVTCLEQSRICDGTNDCPSNLDEMNCEKCAAGQVLCRDLYTCARVCNGVKECKTGEDETGCPVRCPHGFMQCSDRQTCAKVCDRISECPSGGADEMGCPPKCPPGQMLCSDMTTCARPCDGTATCPNGGADEANCPGQCSCAKGQLICDGTNPQCLDRNSVCEGAGDVIATACGAAANLGIDEDGDASGFKCS